MALSFVSLSCSTGRERSVARGAGRTREELGRRDWYQHLLDDKCERGLPPSASALGPPRAGHPPSHRWLQASQLHTSRSSAPPPRGTSLSLRNLPAGLVQFASLVTSSSKRLWEPPASPFGLLLVPCPGQVLTTCRCPIHQRGGLCTGVAPGGGFRACPFGSACGHNLCDVNRPGISVRSGVATCP